MNQTALTIGVDLGNYQIKTAHFDFPSGLCYYEDFEPGYDETIEYDGRFYALKLTHESVERDKTKSNRYYILTLFAVIRECLFRCPDETEFRVNLAIGVVPSAMNRQDNLALRDYFLKEHSIQLKYDGQNYHIELDDFYIFPTGLAAIAASTNDIRKKDRFVIMDIGGGTTEYLIYRNRQIDRAKCFSVNEGTITIASEVMMHVSASYGYDIDGMEIDSVVVHQSSLLPLEVQDMIRYLYQKKAHDMLNRLRDFGMDPRVWTIFLTGGGAQYFYPYFVKEISANGIYFEDNIHANAIGIELLARAEQKRKAIVSTPIQVDQIQKGE